jgi:hypothetical protein
MPIFEAMACQCPVVACRNSSIPKVPDESALFVDEGDVKGLVGALLLLRDQKLRGDYIKRGVSQASRFSFPKMAEGISEALLNAVEGLESDSKKVPSSPWDEVCMLQHEMVSSAEYGVVFSTLGETRQQTTRDANALRAR